MNDENRKRIDALIREFASEYQVKNLELSDLGVCVLRYQDTLDVTFEHPAGSEVLHLYACVGELPSEPAQRLAFCESLMRRHFLGLETGGASFCVNPDGDEVYFSTQTPIEILDSDTFRRLVSGFLPRALEATAQLAEGEAGADSKSTAPTIWFAPKLAS